MSDSIVGRTRHGELTLDQIAGLMPGLGSLMPDIGRRYWICWHAARGGNWPMAGYQLRQMRALLETGIVTRPKFEKDLRAFIQGQVEPLRQTIEARDWAQFDKLYQASLPVIDNFHARSNHPEVRWRLSPEPPKDLDLGPGDAADGR